MEVLQKISALIDWKKKAPNQFLQAEPGDSVTKMELKSPEGDPDPE